MKKIGKYSMGTGDRFGQQGVAQLRAIAKAQRSGVHITPVWNKSHREHMIIGTLPDDVRQEADKAVGRLGWDEAYFVDADHIGLDNVDLFMHASDFFTLDVADFTGKTARTKDIQEFVEEQKKYTGTLDIPGIEKPLDVTEEFLWLTAEKYLLAVQEAGKIYRKVLAVKGPNGFVPEVSMDETDRPQSPAELFFILAAVAREGIPAQTIAPKFSGEFNKGVDYVGNITRFAREFEADICVIEFAKKEFDLPDNLKLSVHSGSDKFSIYAPMKEILEKHDAGLHLKTAGTTWLEELIGLAAAGGQGLKIAKDIYETALNRFSEMCGPYASVIDIDPDNLPPAESVQKWTGEQYANALRHDQSCGEYNSDVRQLLHVAYKVAAEMGQRYLDALDDCERQVAKNVTENLYERHILRLFPL